MPSAIRRPQPIAMLAHFVLVAALLVASSQAAVVVEPRILIRGDPWPVRWAAGIGQKPIQLTPAHVDSVPSTTQARLENVRTLIAEQQWDEAIDTLLDLIEQPSNGVVEISPERYVSLGEYCQIQLARLPPAGLALYRQRVDPVAETWYREGCQSRDRELLGRVVGTMFCSSFGDDALMALGELALEAANYKQARSYWERISPKLRSPTGKSLWLALRGIDLKDDKKWKQVLQLWQQRSEPADWLAYPDSDLNSAEVRARLVLVSIREGAAGRAALELEAFARFHPNAVGNLAGKSQPLADVLTATLQDARTWPKVPGSDDWHTLGGSPARSCPAAAAPRFAGRAWPKPVSLAGPPGSNPGETVRVQSDKLAPPDRPLRFHPLVVDETVLVNSSSRVHAIDFTTGRPAITANGVVYRADGQRPAGSPVGSMPNIVAGVAHHTMTVQDGVVYARVGTTVTGRMLRHHRPQMASTDQAIVGLDLRRDGLLTFKVQPDDGTWAFEGAPLCDTQSLYVAMRHSDVKPRAYVASYDLATGKRRWRTSVAAADTPAAGRGDEITNGLLTMVGQRIYYNTNMGVIAAVSAVDGNIRWLRRYDRESGSTDRGRVKHLERHLTPCVYHAGLVLAAPADSSLIFALDADTGKAVWATPVAGDAVHLLGVADGTLVATGDRCWGLDVRSGRARFVWPESRTAGIKGMGRGCLAGSEIYWPTRSMIYMLDAATGAQTKLPLDLTPFSEAGANLVMAGGRLLIAGPDRLMAFDRYAPPPAQRRQTANRDYRL